MELNLKKYSLAVLASGLWINISEFTRNELFIKELWIKGFQRMGLDFPSAPLNGVIWGLWAFIFAGALALLCSKFTAISSAFIAWVTGFVLLWIAMWNMGVLPSKIIFWAAPWSFFEVLIAAFICSKLLKDKLLTGH